MEILIALVIALVIYLKGRSDGVKSVKRQYRSLMYPKDDE